VVDLGSGSGMDAPRAADYVGSSGPSRRIDFTLEQLEKACKLAAGAGAAQVEFLEGRIEAVPLADASPDCVISNGVINLAPTRTPCSPRRPECCVRADAWRSPTSSPRSPSPRRSCVTPTDLWASCIGGAAEQVAYLQAIGSAGFRIDCLDRRTAGAWSWPRCERTRP
jgi:arsenite methyltransferase